MLIIQPIQRRGTHNEKNAPNIEANFEVYYLDVGQADSILIKQKSNTMLIDAGNNEDGKKIVDYLKNDLSITHFNYLIGTHYHEDHIGGMDDVINNFDTDTFYAPYESEFSTKSARDVEKAAKNHSLKITNPNIGTSFKLGDASCEIVYVDNNEPEEKNNSSIVMKVTYGAQTYLFSGDAEFDVESKLNVGKINVYKVGHHGSKSSSTEEFIKRIDPDYAIISVGPNNDYYYPAPRVTKRLTSICDEVYRTDTDGTIHLISDGNNVVFEKIKTVCLDGNDR